MRYLIGAGVIALALASPGIPLEDVRRACAGDDVGDPRPRIVNGVPEPAFPSVGALLAGFDADTASAWCSGTLIGCETFLTAAHCVEGIGPARFQVFVPSAGMLAVTSIAMHPGFDFPAGDIAVLKLAAPVNGVAPSRIATAGPPPFGSPGTIVGFGRSGGASNDYGLKRSGKVVTAPCTSIPSPGDDSTSVCWRFTDPLGPPGSDSNTCNADSGGPLFVDLGAGEVVAGVTSGGTSESCLPADDSYDANVFTYSGFIQTEGGPDLARARCGDLPQVGAPGMSVLAFSGDLSAASPSGTHTFQVPAGTTVLRVAMNAIDDGASDFDLYVKAAATPTPSDFDCRRNGPNQYGICELAEPAAGTWHVLVSRFRGAGTYQLTVSLFGIDCAVPGSDGTPCDDGNPCTGGDACQVGACVGSPVANGTPCDDGNACTQSDACQAGICGGTAVANGTPCDDGLRCTQPDVCQGGICGGSAPALGCKRPAPGASFLQLVDRSPDTRDRLLWIWKKGAATARAEFGDPTSTTGYSVCLYDERGGAPQSILERHLPAGSRWSRLAHGFRYRDPTLAQGGISSVTLREGASGRALVSVAGKGPPLALPPLPLAQRSAVTMQLLNGSTCWEASYSTSTRNVGDRFRAKSD